MKKIVSAIISGGLFAALIVLLGRYDVAQIGPDGTVIGFSTINNRVHEMTGVNMSWYELTDILGYLAICVCALFGLVGLVQLIKRKSLLKVDKTIYALGCFYIVVIGCYIFFEKFIVNYRPIVMPGDTAPEASFPSSHTMLIITVMASAAMVAGLYIHNKALRTIVRLICDIIIVVTVFGRLYCGVHWFTDIIGGILLSITLLSLFSAVYSKTLKADRKNYGHDDESDDTHEFISFTAPIEKKEPVTPSLKPIEKADKATSVKSGSDNTPENLYADMPEFEGRLGGKTDKASGSGEYVPKH